MDDYNLPLAEFYFYLIGDKTTYNQELNDLFVGYTLARGLQLYCDTPRRPALPLEIILRITRHAGLIDPKPDLFLCSNVFILAKSLIESGGSSDFYISTQLSRVQLASMARIQLVNIFKNPKAEVRTVIPIPPVLLPSPQETLLIIDR